MIVLKSQELLIPAAWGNRNKMLPLFFCLINACVPSFFCHYNLTEIRFFWHTRRFYIQPVPCVAVCYRPKESPVMFKEVDHVLHSVLVLLKGNHRIVPSPSIFHVFKKLTIQRISTFSQVKTCTYVCQEGMQLLHWFVSSGWKDVPGLFTGFRTLGPTGS